MLELVAHHHLAQHAVAGARTLDHRRAAGADGRQVLARGGRVEQLDFAAHGARRLERVVDGGEVGAQQLLAAVAVADPQVLVGGDVREIPHQRAHDRRELLLEPLVREVGDEPERALRAWSNAASTDSASEVRGWVGAARTAIGGCGSL